MFPECRQNDYLAAISKEAPSILGPKRKSILKRPTEEPLDEKIKKLGAKQLRAQSKSGIGVQKLECMNGA